MARAVKYIVDDGIGFNKGTIDTLSFSSDHSFVDTQFKYLLKKPQKGLLAEYLSGSADGAVKEKLLL